jgi:predicted CXXCH cytochrome family protein
MPKSRIAKKQKRRKFILTPMMKVGLAGLGLAVLLAVSGFTFAATKETHDSFCASCHTQPESTFYQRSVDPQPVDLASAHTPKNTRCIDCHSGTGIFGRMQAELLGAHNALAYYTHTAIQPAKLTRAIGDESCLKCHQNVTAEASFNTHFHAFLPRWQAVDPNAATCVTCHTAHTTDGNGQLMYLNESTAGKVCNACHQVLREGQ